jgi:hypothetical protein
MNDGRLKEEQLEILADASSIKSSPSIGTAASKERSATGC